MSQSPEQKIVTLDDIERRHIVNHRDPYFNWIRHVVTLAVGALTALVALQGHYVPHSPKLSGALAVCWVSLAATIGLGLLALQEEYLSCLAEYRHLRTMRAMYGDIVTTELISRNYGARQPWHHKWAVRLMLLSFFVALSSLCIFAVVNLGAIR